MNKQDRWINHLSSPTARFDIEILGFTALDAKWHFENRQVDEHLLYLVVRNDISCKFGRKNLTVRPGELLWLSPGTTHTFINRDLSNPATLFHVRVTVADEPPVPIKLLHVTNVWHLRSHFERLLEEHASPMQFSQSRIAATFILIFTEALRAAKSNKTGSRLSEVQRRRIYELVAKQHERLLTPADLAEVAELSPDYFSRVFRSTFGQPPRRWLLQMRIQQAATRLQESTETFTQIAEQMGFCDVYLFSRQFKQVMGESPKQYRKRHLQPRAAQGKESPQRTQRAQR